MENLPWLFLIILLLILTILTLSVYLITLLRKQNEKLENERMEILNKAEKSKFYKEELSNKVEVDRMDRLKQSEKNEPEENIVNEANELNNEDIGIETIKTLEIEDEIIERLKIANETSDVDIKPDKTVSASWEETKERLFEIGWFDSNALEIMEIIKNRGISELLHFTNMDNIKSIIEKGFFPVGMQSIEGINARINDMDRYDNKLYATSFSIGFPNYKMFYSVRNKEENKNSKWLILSVRSDILLSHEENIYYCENNGATREMTNKNNDKLKEPKALENMFKETLDTRYYGKINRNDLNIPRNYTTDPQAEVLIEGYISGMHINSIYVSSYDDYYLLKEIIKDRIYAYNVDIIPNYFRARMDYKFWKKEHL